MDCLRRRDIAVRIKQTVMGVVDMAYRYGSISRIVNLSDQFAGARINPRHGGWAIQVVRNDRAV